MAHAITLDPHNEDLPIGITPAPAAGLFGYSIINGKMQACKPISGYIRDIEQMPNFTPPSAEIFAAQYIASNLGRTRSSS